MNSPRVLRRPRITVFAVRRWRTAHDAVDAGPNAVTAWNEGYLPVIRRLTLVEGQQGFVELVLDL